MGLIEKLKLLFKTAKPVGQYVDQIKGGKLKWKTIPFWVSTFGLGISIVAGFQGLIPATTAAIISGVLISGYNILRGLDKAGQEGVKPTLKSTEFWLGTLAILSTELMKVKAAGVDNEITSTISIGIATAMALAQNIGAQQPNDVKKMLEQPTDQSEK